MAGWQQLFWGGEPVSVIQASADNEGLKSHHFELKSQLSNPHNDQATVPDSSVSTEQVNVKTINVNLETNLVWQPFSLDYRLTVDDALVAEGSRNTKDIERQIPV